MGVSSQLIRDRTSNAPSKPQFHLPVVVKKCQCGEEERYHEVEGENMVVTVIP